MKRYKPSEKMPKDGQKVLIMVAPCGFCCAFWIADQERFDCDGDGEIQFDVGMINWWADPMEEA